MNKNDEILLARFVDGELSGVERQAFENRMQSDPDLTAAVRRAGEARDLVRSGFPAPMCAPVGFGAALMDRVRGLPSREHLIHEAAAEEAVVGAVSYGRRLLVAALLIFGVALLFSTDLLRGTDGGDLQANPDLMRRLDEKVRAEQVDLLKGEDSREPSRKGPTLKVPSGQRLPGQRRGKK